MPSPEGEEGIEEMSVDIMPKELESKDDDDSTSKLPVLESEFGKSSRINAKRKPDKSKIFRIRTNDLEEQSLCCDKCSKEFDSQEELGDHEKSCMLVESTSELNYPDVLKRHQDEANNNQANLSKSPTRPSTPNSRELSPVRCNGGYDSDTNQQLEVSTNPFAKIRKLYQHSSSQMPIAQQLVQSNMALEAIQNTRLALAQFASNALGNGQPASPQAAQEMAILQNTLYTLQHQQMMQLQLIQQLQAQLSIKNKEVSANNLEDENSSEGKEELLCGGRNNTATPIPNKCLEINEKFHQVPVTSSFITNLMERFKSPLHDSVNEKAIPPLSSELQSASDTEERPTSPPRTAANIASSVIQHTDPPPSDEPNTLEMLQRTANQVLNNASQGLLTNRLIDDYNKPPEGKDSYYKHRCRYCGKVFGSDSALQIHVRSHTGERPFKCNICGNRFTTKGNLKVHFQRHSARFPHVKMNPHPVPEHLDKLHPPLLAQLGELKDYPSPPTGPPNPFSSPPTLGPPLPPFRLPVPMPPPVDMHKSFNLNTTDHSRKERSRSESEEPENQSAKSDTRNSFESERNEENIESLNMVVDERSSHSEEHIKVEPDIPENESSQDNESDKDEPSQRYLNFRDPLHEVFRNNLRQPLSEKFQETLRNSIHEHLKESIKDSFREKLDNPILKDMQLGPPKPLNELFNDSLSEPYKDILKTNLKEIAKDDNLDKNKIEEREIAAVTPNELRIRTEKELKEASDNDKSLKENNMDTDSSDSHSETSEQPTDLRIRQEFRPLGFPSMPFPGPRLPLNFQFIPGLASPFTMTSGAHTPVSMPPNMNITRDPNMYSNLLPRPGSTDNSWEALIEITKTSETMKLEQLVNNIEHKLSDPNQCFICHRVLSCKSALQMHYRTHTGERPFKCKICGRAFTTKGNLKTHMGVHRAKPPMRMLHQCPVCHKKFTNALVLQQHIRLHTGEPTDLTPEQIAAAEVRDYPPGFPIQSSMPHLLSGGFPLGPQSLSGFPPIPLHLRYQLSPEILRRYESEMEERRDEEEKYLRLFNNSSRSSSTGSVEQRNAEDLSLRMRGEEALNEANSPRHSVSPTPSDYSDLGEQSHDGQLDSHNNFMERLMSTPISQAVTSLNNESVPQATTPLDLTPKPPPPLFTPFGLFPPPLTSASSSPGSQAMTNMNPLYLSSIPGMGNTTCHICFKTFACQSALEIHYRSHTKERPYKCNVCDRGFSTKQGNMKQHMLTHKIRDPNGEKSENSNSCSSGDKTSSDAKTTIGNKAKNDEDASEMEEVTETTKEGDKRDDPSFKREREGELLSLPVPKRPSALQEDAPNSEDEPVIHDEPPVLSPEVPIRRPFSPGRNTSPNNSVSPPSPLPFQSPFSLPSMLHIPSSLPLPPSLSLPSSLAFSSPLSLPICPPGSLGLSPAQPLPHS